MRLSKLFTLIEQADPNKIYVIGDSHAVAIGKSIGGTEVLASNGATLSQIGAQAQSVPDGSRVIVTGGANDTRTNHNAAGAAVKKILRGLKSRGCTPIYVSFPPIDLNGEFADVYREAGLNNQYNLVQQFTSKAASSELGANYVTGLTMSDISPGDPQAIHATPAAYNRVAQGIVQQFKKTPPKTTGDNQVSDPRLVPVNLEGFEPEEIAALDVDGDGKVTTGDLSDVGVTSSLFA